jgi:hypothetical protein
MASEKQIEANRRNALKSTGPKTQAGRARSRMNALKHGLSRKAPPSSPPDPRVLPLARAIAGDGVTDPAALAAAEEIAVESLTLASIRIMRASLVADCSTRTLPAPAGADAASDDLATTGEADDAADDPATTRGADDAPRPDPVQELQRLERFERQALTRRSRALLRLAQIPAPTLRVM